MDYGTSKRERKYGKRFVASKLKINKKQKIEEIQKLRNEAKYKQTLQNIEYYLERYGEDCYILLELGKIYFSTERLEEAKEILTKIITKNSENKYYALYELAKTNRALKQYDEAKNNLKQILASNHPEKCHAKLELARLYETMGEDIKAEENLLGLIDDNELNMYSAVYDLANLKIRRGHSKEALEYLKQLKGNVEQDNVDYLYGKYFLLIGNYEKAKIVFNRIKEKGNKFPIKVPHQLAVVEYLQDNFQKAIEMEENILRKNTILYRESVILIIDCYMKLRNKEKALEYIDILKENPYYTLNDDLNYMMGKIAIIDKQWLKALEYFNKVEKRNNTAYRDVLFKKCCVYAKLNEIDKLEEMLNELDSLNIYGKYDGIIRKMHTYVSDRKYHNIEVNDSMSYVELQIINYDKERAIEHIKLHQKPDSTKENHSIFSDNINIENLYEEVLDHLNDETFHDSNLVDCYILNYPNVGYCEDKISDLLKVITLPNTKEIVTMYPYVKNKALLKSKPKVKKLSQIDKFNQKYKLK